jgi:hypothetical protein
MSLLSKVTVDQAVTSNESLRLTNRFELAHLPLLLPRFLM